MSTIAVIDFETTGISPATGARATEIAVVLVREGSVVDRYASLMNAGAYVPWFIEQLTGITNEMVGAARPAAAVMREVADFIGARPMVAHNASFDRRFWEAELARIGRPATQPFACTMRLSRRLFPDAPNHKLATLVRFAKLPVAGRVHRALADAEMAAALLGRMSEDVRARFRIDVVPHELLCAIQASPRNRLDRCIARHLGRSAAGRPIAG